jgi:hypothetical protein
MRSDDIYSSSQIFKDIQVPGGLIMAKSAHFGANNYDNRLGMDAIS